MFYQVKAHQHSSCHDSLHISPLCCMTRFISYCLRAHNPWAAIARHTGVLDIVSVSLFLERVSESFYWEIVVLEQYVTCRSPVV